MTHNREFEPSLIKRALVISIADQSFYLGGYTDEPEGQSETIDLVRDTKGRPKRFASLTQAKDWFEQQGAERAWLVMQTPYDEMIGNESLSSSELPMILSKEDD